MQGGDQNLIFASYFIGCLIFYSGGWGGHREPVEFQGGGE